MSGRPLPTQKPDASAAAVEAIEIAVGALDAIASATETIAAALLTQLTPEQREQAGVILRQMREGDGDAE